MGSWPLAQSLFYQYKRTMGRLERLRGNRSAQTAATLYRPSTLINNAAKISPNKPPPAQSREEICGPTPAPRRLAAARPPQPRESGPARHPNTGPGAEGGGGWPMQAMAQPWHDQDGRRRPEPCGGCSAPGDIEELHQQDAPVDVGMVNALLRILGLWPQRHWLVRRQRSSPRHSPMDRSGSALRGCGPWPAPCCRHRSRVGAREGCSCA